LVSIGSIVTKVNMKQCTVCKEQKEPDLFYKNAYRCKSCDNKARKKYRLDNPEKALASQRRRNYKHKYGLTVEEYNSILKRQDGCCAICKSVTSFGPYGSQRLAIDHCHKTDNVRGLLCNRCNRALGLLQDDITVLLSAIKYLETH